MTSMLATTGAGMCLVPSTRGKELGTNIEFVRILVMINRKLSSGHTTTAYSRPVFTIFSILSCHKRRKLLVWHVQFLSSYTL